MTKLKSFKNIKNTLLPLLLCIFFLPFILAACNKSKKANPIPTGLSPDAVNTAAAQTAESRRNQAGSLTPTNPPLPTFDATSIAVTQAAATLQAQVTPSPVGTAKVTPSPLAVSPTLTLALPIGKDNSVFTGKETIPDGTVFAPGEKFTKSWQFMNTGQTTWTTAYKLVFSSGEQMGGPASVLLKIEVPAGRVVDISVDLQAPANTGSYKGFWRLSNSAGQVFGDTVYVQIDVAEGGGAAPTATAPATGKVTDVTLSVDEGSFTGSCPHTFNFTAQLQLNKDADVTYVLEFGGGITAPDMSPVTVSMSAGSNQVAISPEFIATGSGWARLHITAPNEISSKKVNFSLTCQP